MSEFSTISLNNQDYEIDISLWNYQTQLTIPTGIVETLVITDSIYSVWKTGVIVINSTGNVIDTFVKEDVNNLKERLSSVGYAFNIDSRDRFEIKLRPVNPSGRDSFPDKTWSMHFHFSIFDEDELVESTGIVKRKIFHLREYPEQLLRDNSIQWSTADIASIYRGTVINLNHASNNARRIHTGVAIANLLNKSLDVWFNGPKTAEDIKDYQWDIGKTKIFYTSTPQRSCMHALEYLLDNHISSNSSDNCILGSNSSSSEYFLISIEDIYKKAYLKDNQLGEFFIDAFNVSTGGPTMSRATGMNASAQISTTTTYGIPDDIASRLDGISNFSFLNISNDDSLNDMVTTHVHNYNYREKQFSIDCRDTYIVSIRNRMKELYTNKMKGVNVQPVLPLNDDKIWNKSLKNVYSTGVSRDERRPDGINRTLKKAFAFAPCITFDAKGQTNRKSARHLIMLSSQSDRDTSFSKLFIGEWMTTSVQHIFLINKGQYYNTVVAVKPHSSSPLMRGEFAGSSINNAEDIV